MKKIIILILFIIILSGCYKKEGNLKEKNSYKKEKTIVTKKYYSYTVARYDHDDYDVKLENVNHVDYKVNNDSLDEINSEETIGINNNYEEFKEEKVLDKEEKDDKIIKKEDVLTEDNDEVNNEKKDDVKDEIKENITTDNKELQLPILNEKKEEVLEDKKENLNYNVKEELNENKEKVQSGYYSPNGKYLGTTNVKVIDVSYYQGDINWDLFAKESDCYGVILSLGYYTTLDKKFESYIKDIKRLNIPYGIYLFSYSKSNSGALKEANFVNSVIDKYNLTPTLGIFYDIESWSSKNSNSDDISKSMYDSIIQIFINKVSNYVNYKYKVKVYSGRWYAMNRLGPVAKTYVDWVAEYNNTCKYDSNYSMWQYTSKAKVPGISTYVDVSYILN